MFFYRKLDRHFFRKGGRLNGHQPSKNKVRHNAEKEHQQNERRKWKETKIKMKIKMKMKMKMNKN